jgi:hypothetical protein
MIKIEKNKKMENAFKLTANLTLGKILLLRRILQTHDQNYLARDILTQLNNAFQTAKINPETGESIP